jgi:hypothetical protein
VTTLTIDRLSAAVHVSPDDLVSAPRVERLMRAVADEGLDAEMARQPWPDGIVCIGRVDATLTVGDLDDDRLVAAWSQVLASALADAACAGSVVRYPHELAALIDLVTEVAAGRATRAWAWRQAGILDAADPSVRSEPVAALLAALSRRPAYAPAALIAAVRAVGVPALDRMLGRDGWERVLRVLVTTGPASTPAGPTRAAILSGRDVALLGDRVLAASAVAARVRASRLLLSDQAAETLAVLAIAEAEPARLVHGSSALIPLVAARLRATPAGAEIATSPPELVARGRSGSTAEDLAVGGTTDDGDQDVPDLPDRVDRPDHLDLPARPALPNLPRRLGRPDRLGLPARPALPDLPRRLDRPDWRDLPARPERPDRPALPRPDVPDRLGTSWAGLPFLLALAGDLDLPERTLDDPVLGSRPLPWVLRETATRLVDADRQDPGVRAFSGRMDPDRTSTPLVDTGESTALDDLAGAWARACLDRLLAAVSDQSDPGLDPHDPAGAVLRVASRPGEIEASPGWIDVLINAGAADTLVRRAGLDLDPGWIPWLGIVLRYRYV